MGAENRVDDIAERGFGAGAGAYERGRPGYPPQVVDILAEALDLRAGRRVLDLAAGTGKMTRPLLSTGASIVAVEPVAGMREVLAEGCPGAEVLDGTAEAIPLEPASVDAAVVAQAFHWFDPPKALAELARVVRPGGGLALVWNRRDESVPWVGRMSEVMGWHDYPVSSYERTDWPSLVGLSDQFGAVTAQQVRWDMDMTRDALADRVRSVSYIAAGDAETRERIVSSVLRLVDDQAEPFSLPYVSLLFWCRRL
jgi:SAM-dependent methyltransferase